VRSILIGFAIILAVGAVILVARLSFSLREASAQDKQMAAAFVPKSTNKTLVVVRGWSRDELDKILSYFLSSYELPQSTLEVSSRSDNTLVLTFPNDIPPKFLYFLVNYIQYPKEFYLTHRSIGVIAHVILGPAFGIPDNALAGKSADVYVPSNDADYDLVYARVETGQAYQISFTDLIWRPVADPRVPSTISGL